MGRSLPLGLDEPRLMTSTEAHLYFADGKDYDRVMKLAQGCARTGIVARAMAPIRAFRLNQNILTVDSPALYDLEDSLPDGSEVITRQLFGNELAQQILASQLAKGVEIA